ncbi:pilus assembly protein [Oceanimonas pelagia]|uniref:Pilus assembly protein n=1 Tax=Oceanimonas pelagia TaxID=3028314 RepID=A0AA50KRT0_9GAMM|nr:pilus assembly protein [Oceanimonas pelagia]WMC11885.1 pilus assembly protein [Oceanimonas pelagia]
MFIAKELLRLVNDEDGLTVVEYAIAGGLVAAGVVTAFVGLGERVDLVITDLCGSVGKSDAASAATKNC